MTDAEVTFLFMLLFLPVPLAFIAMYYTRAQVWRALLNVGALLFYGPGYAAGALVRFVTWARDAIIAGYRHGRNEGDN